MGHAPKRQRVHDPEADMDPAAPLLCAGASSCNGATVPHNGANKRRPTTGRTSDAPLLLNPTAPADWRVTALPRRVRWVAFRRALCAGATQI